jgi:hypothetical protein
MHRPFPLVALVALAACSSSGPSGNQTDLSRVPDNNLAPATATQSDTAQPVAASNAKPTPGTLKTFGDWAVGCDNIDRCTMASLGPDGGEFPTVNMLLARDAGPDGAVTITLEAQDNDGSPPPTPANIAIDGNPLSDSFSGKPPVLTGQPALAAAKTIPNGHQLTVRSAAGKTIATLSLKGASAALRYIDAQQGRAGTTTAIVATGGKPASAVPAGPAEPQVVGVIPIGSAVTPPKPLLAKMSNRAQCDDAGPGGELQTFAIGGDTTLVLVPCGAGAYNVLSAVFVVKGGDASPALMDAPTGIDDGENKSAIHQLVNADFSDGVLTSDALGRGLGDCGIEQKFVWDGARFRLIEQSEMSECRGDPNYITTWRAKVARR